MFVKLFVAVTKNINSVLLYLNNEIEDMSFYFYTKKIFQNTNCRKIKGNNYRAHSKRNGPESY